MPTNDEENEHEEECVKVIGNEVLFYGDVDRENALEFVEKFKKLEIDLLKKKAELVLLIFLSIFFNFQLSIDIYLNL